MIAVPKTSQQSTDLDLLKRHAEALWDAQQDVFTAAGNVAREAGNQGVTFARDEVAPRIRQVAADGAGAVRSTYGRVAPAAASALATAAAIGDQSIRLVLARLAKARGTEIVPVAAAPAKRGIGVGGWIGITVGVIAAGAIAYAVWQTLRADDDLWIEDEPELEELEAAEDEAAESPAE